MGVEAVVGLQLVEQLGQDDSKLHPEVFEVEQSQGFFSDNGLNLVEATAELKNLLGLPGNQEHLEQDAVRWTKDTGRNGCHRQLDECLKHLLTTGPHKLPSGF
ncbi:MAG: hypothetical protein HC888_04315 [Candidatus Competibacteraceae bacterium]|nr:hypothetical protein [Candidatus Competibacteraceae bacterium]